MWILNRRSAQLLPARAWVEDDLLFPRTRQRLHQRQSLRRRLGIGQRTLHRGLVGLGEKERVGVPVEQLIVHRLLRPHIAAHDPYTPPRSAREQRRQHRPRAFHHLLKHHHRRARPHRSQLLRERRRGGEFVE